jgi:phosphate:Na+ symporter
LADLLNNYERISDHCSNIAVTTIEIDRDELEQHEYLNAVKMFDEEFANIYKDYKSKYTLE